LLTAIDFAFTRPPSLRELIAAIEKQFGLATQNHLVESSGPP